MSRRFARQMDRNKKQLNETQRKSGKQGTLKASNETKFIGRSWLLPSFLIGMLIWYLILFIGDKGFMFWFTVVGYTLLSLFLFFIKRPYLVVGKDFVESRRFGGVFKIQVSEIEKITIAKDSVNIAFNVKRPSWSFTSLFQMMKIADMSEKLTEFAQKNQIQLVHKEK
jgi:hypothetical protein